MSKPNSARATLAATFANSLGHNRFLPKAAAAEAAFHMTDWLSELDLLDAALRAPSPDAAAVQEALIAFAAHAPAHLAALHKIVMGTPVTDAFELGAVKGSGRAKRKPGDGWRRTDRKPRAT